MILNKLFHYELGANVWRIVPDMENNLLAIEVRGQGEADFATLDAITGEILCNGLTFPATNSFVDWGIEIVYKGIMILYRYREISQMPTHEGIWAVDMRTGQLIFEDKNLVFKEIDNLEQALAFRHEQPDNVVILPLSFEPTANSIDAPSQWLAPQHYPENSQHSTMLAEFVKQKTTHSPIAVFDYMEKNAYIFLSYYIRTAEGNNNLDNYFLALDTEGRILLHLCLAKSLSGIGIDTFFVWNDRLFLIVNKTELIGYELNSL